MHKAMDKRYITRFKSCHVGRGRNLQEDIEKLSKDMQDLWTKRNFVTFLNKFSSLLDKRPFPPGIEAILPFLSELSISYDREIHKKIGECYQKCKEFADETEDETGLVRTMACSSNSYLRRTITENRKVTPTSEPSLALSTKLLTTKDIKEQTLYEDTIRLEFQKSNVYTFLDIFLDFIKKLYYYPLKLTSGEFPSRPGVYFISYIGNKELYPGSQVDALLPVYVGMSKKSIREGLNGHRGLLTKAQNLKVTDFVVQFMIVDDKNFASYVELTLIEHFCPVWNSTDNHETPEFSFGVDEEVNNLWDKCHIQADGKTLDTTVKHLSIKDNGPENEA